MSSTKDQKIAKFDPNGVGLQNGNFIGLPFDEQEADIILLPVPWDVTVSYTDGTSMGPANILEASAQLDLEDTDVKNAWHYGIHWLETNNDLIEENKSLRVLAKSVIDCLEAGIPLDNKHLEFQQKINEACENLKNRIFAQTTELLQKNKLIGLVGGDHSTPLGYLSAIDNHYQNSGFGILHIDAHMDLRKAYEGFEYSHASIFYNAIKGLKNCKKLVQVGIRDFCQEEMSLAKDSDLISVYTMQAIRESQFQGQTYDQIVTKIIEDLPPMVYISFDIDGLDPSLCPNTGTPVGEGFSFFEAVYLIKKIVQAKKKIIGFDLVEVGGLGNEWDGNVGARILYKMANLARLSWDLN